MAYRLGWLAEQVGGAVEGDPERRIEAIRTLEAAGPTDLAFFTSPRYRRQAEASRAGALLVGRETRAVERDRLVADDPYWALARLLALLNPRQRPPAGVHPTAVIEEGCAIDPSAHVGAHAVVGRGSRVGAGAVLHPHVVIGRGCRVGAGAELFSQVVLYDGSEVGDDSILHAGVVLGSDGFGYAAHGGRHEKIPQVGRAVVEADVEIGANTTVDRATLEETRIGAGTKIDNLVQVAHNVHVGRGCLLVAQAGIAGSTRLGDGVVMAGQSGAAGHLEIGDGVRVAAKSAVFKSVPAGRQVAGIPAVEAAAWRRRQALLTRLADFERRLRAVEARFGRTEEKVGE